MKKTTFWEIVILFIIAGIIFYIVCPKYTMQILKREPMNQVYRLNTITGCVWVLDKNGDWLKISSFLK